MNLEDPKPKYLDREMKGWKKAEYSSARILKGKRIMRSGAEVYNKGDVELPNFLLEVKSTDYNSIIIESKWLIKIDNEARGKNKLPGVVICFNKMPDPLNKWVMIPIMDFANLIKK